MPTETLMGITGWTDSCGASGLTSFTTPYFINKENLNWGAKYAYIWAGSNLATFGIMRQHPRTGYGAVLTVQL